MKALVLGIDGGTLEVLEGMPMPFLHSYIKNYDGPELEIDLLSRGWAEQLTGTYARENKGFYMKPKLDGSHDIEFKYSLGDMLENPNIVPLWQRVNEMGGTVGIMNVPTTFPAQEVDGFFVSGAGGGLNKVDGIPPEMCHPSSASKALEDQNYIVDIRMGTANFSTIDELLSGLEAMAQARTESFIELSKTHKIDFGFLAYRHTCVIQYLAPWEIEQVLSNSEENEASPIWQERLRDVFAKFDRLLESIITELKPEHVIFSSDHGLGGTKEHYCPNALLEEGGLLVRKVNVLKSIERSLRNKKFVACKEINWNKTLAFSDWYSPSIYINDLSRFNGLVEEVEVEDLVHKICHLFNHDPEFRQRSITATPYRSKFNGATYEKYMPDVRLVCASGDFVKKKRGPKFMKNPTYGPVASLEGVHGGMHSGNKTPYPFFCTDPKTAQMIRENDTNDLTLVYKLVERIFER